MIFFEIKYVPTDTYAIHILKDNEYIGRGDKNMYYFKNKRTEIICGYSLNLTEDHLKELINNNNNKYLL